MYLYIYITFWTHTTETVFINWTIFAFVQSSASPTGMSIYHVIDLRFLMLQVTFREIYFSHNHARWWEKYLSKRRPMLTISGPQHDKKYSYQYVFMKLLSLKYLTAHRHAPSSNLEDFNQLLTHFLGNYLAPPPPPERNLIFSDTVFEKWNLQNMWDKQFFSTIHVLFPFHAKKFEKVFNPYIQQNFWDQVSYSWYMLHCGSF